MSDEIPRLNQPISATEQEVVDAMTGGNVVRVLVAPSGLH